MKSIFPKKFSEIAKKSIDIIIASENTHPL